MEQNDEMVSAETVEAPAQQEKMLPQSEVNKIVGRAKAEAEQKVLRQIEEENRRKLESSTKQEDYQQSPASLDADAISQQLLEKLNYEFEKKKAQEQANRIYKEYQTQVEEARKSYDDFDEVTHDLELGAFGDLAFLISEQPNMGDIVYELAKNKHKLVTLDALLQRSEKAARSELSKLSKSILNNKKAAQNADEEVTNAPLDRLQPSRVTTGSNGKQSIRDLRSQPWLRG